MKSDQPYSCFSSRIKDDDSRYSRLPSRDGERFPAREYSYSRFRKVLIT
ncbi:hypothetical protein LEP1GSC058_2165 [Leptospira fainei serovar Hurstbridge str. BUT 6]|uniref:Uncharacterized protein n=1 Tax=Leptospira fainei serovar Hurstbridge str. BUT 6 TaxID=1193011 RepID=S3VGL1_9LEPT|nr:hypothetical protein LEP1GSC058_2165 [Leptospira fainei serovar Hurstbridge str. BUT 6]